MPAAAAPFTPPPQQQAAVAAAAAAAYLSSAANNGPPPNAPFIAAPAAPPQPAVNLGVGQFINPNGIPGVPSYPGAPMPAVTVPISVPIVHHDSGPPHQPPAGFVPGPPNPLFDAAAAAAALGGMPGGAEVRGGVTYFNPSVQMQGNPAAVAAGMMPPVQPMVPPVQHVQKRPKAAIPIVDPNNGAGGGGQEMAAAAGMTKQGSTEDSDNSSSSKNSSAVNAVK